VKESQQCKVTMLKGDRNQNGKKNTKKKITGKKDRKLSNKRAKMEKLHNVLEGSSQKEVLQN
jgi:hypothetical protein